MIFHSFLCSFFLGLGGQTPGHNLHRHWILSFSFRCGCSMTHACREGDHQCTRFQEPNLGRIFSEVFSSRSFSPSKTDDGASDTSHRERKEAMEHDVQVVHFFGDGVRVRDRALDLTIGSAVVRRPVREVETPTDTC